MKKIIVAGAGHAGLVAAAKMAGAGLDVTVIERGRKEDLGHDWEDRFDFGNIKKYLGIDVEQFPEGSWKYRGDCAFVSPAKRKHVIINYTDETRQKIIWRKPLIGMLLTNAENKGVKFRFETEITEPQVRDNAVVGIKTASEEITADLVIDACGVFSPLRSKLPDSMGIEKMPRHGDLFYAYRAYFERDKSYPLPEVPFEVYMYHEGEQGLSWFNTYEDYCDVLIGRIDKLTDEKVKEQLAIFKEDHPWLTEKTVHGGQYGIIPVRRPLTLMVADGYAAAGDSAFMTMPMNGMGIDLSLHAGNLLADTVIGIKGNYTKEALWTYNREFHKLYGGEASKNEGLKNAILSLPSVGVDFLFENDVIQSSDLAGAGRNTNFASLLGKFGRGMRNPKFFFALINGLVKGAGTAKLYKNAPQGFDKESVRLWDEKIKSNDIEL